MYDAANGVTTRGSSTGDTMLGVKLFLQHLERVCLKSDTNYDRKVEK